MRKKVFISFEKMEYKSKLAEFYSKNEKEMFLHLENDFIGFYGNSFEGWETAYCCSTTGEIITQEIYEKDGELVIVEDYLNDIESVETEKMQASIKELIGREMTLAELMKKANEIGYHDESDMTNSVIDKILESGVVVFINTCEKKTIIDFEVTTMADKDEEWLGASYIKITDIY